MQTYISSVEANGYALSFAFATMFSRDAVVLAISDAVLVSTTVLCVPFAKAVVQGRLRYYWTGVVFQHLFQTIVLVAAVVWTYHRYDPLLPRYRVRKCDHGSASDNGLGSSRVS